jgi:ABC-type transport system involved in cytochrome c biogenesis permease subunit
MKTNETGWRKWLPWAITTVMALWVVANLRGDSSKKQFDTVSFGKIPALLNGRIQPMDSVARNSLLMLRGKQTALVPDPKDSSKEVQMPAIDWLLEAMTRPDDADKRKIFRIDNQEVLGMLKLSVDQKFFSFNELKDGWGTIEREVAAIKKTDREESTYNAREKQIMKVQFALGLYFQIKNSLKPESSPDFSKEIAMYQEQIGPGVEALNNREHSKDYDQEALQMIVQFFKRYDMLSKAAYPMVVPPLDLSKGRGEWQTIGASLLEAMRSREVNPAVVSYAKMATAYANADAAAFNAEVAKYRAWLGERYAPEVRKGIQESFFNYFAPFVKAISIYLLAFLFGCAYWFNWAKWTNRTSFYLLVLAFTVHTIGLVFRMYLEGRPPVTNLYSSAIFVGWGAVGLGLILERIFKDGIGGVTAACVGVITLIIAHNLSLDGDTMKMLVAVLDTNFWLATHVVVITLGYASMFLAGALAVIYILRGVFTTTLSAATAKGLSRMIYGIFCFATLFSFVGTILGGIWADQSWGRFWGWDPKENGALLIVLWCAVVLHARWGGMIREKGLIALAIIGNIITSFSWFGVNMLNVGLHSYGFTDEGAKWLRNFVIAQLVLLILAVMPKQYWRSFNKPVAEGKREEGEKPSGARIPKPKTA